MQLTADQMLERMSIPATENGPMVSALRAELNRQIKEHGLASRSGGTCTAAYYAMSSEEKARVWLAQEWDLQRGYWHSVSGIDPVVQWRYDLRLDKRYLEIDWPNIPSRIADKLRWLAMKLRVFVDRHILRVRNPYRSPERSA